MIVIAAQLILEFIADFVCNVVLGVAGWLYQLLRRRVGAKPGDSRQTASCNAAFSRPEAAGTEFIPENGAGEGVRWRNVDGTEGA